MTRKNISKKLRFEIFKRDAFTCQYCGAKAPDVILELDHIIPVAKSGTTDILNLITACKACNAGKSDRELSDNSVIERQREQLSELQERKEQIEMMIEWQRELAVLDDYAEDKVSNFWAELVSPYKLNENGMGKLKKLLTKFGYEQVMEAMRISVKQYVEYHDDKPVQKTVEEAWRKIGGICKLRISDRDDPDLKEIYYIRGIIRNRFNYVDEGMALGLLKKSVKVGASLEYLKEIALEFGNWSSWRTEMEKYIQYLVDSQR